MHPDVGIVGNDGHESFQGTLVMFGAVIEFSHIEFMSGEVLEAFGDMGKGLPGVRVLWVLAHEPAKNFQGLGSRCLIPVDGVNSIIIASSGLVSFPQEWHIC